MYKTLDLKLCYYHYVPKRVQAHIVKAMQNQCKIMSLENVQTVKTMKVSPLPLTILGKVHLEVGGGGGGVLSAHGKDSSSRTWPCHPTHHRHEGLAGDIHAAETLELSVQCKPDGKMKPMFIKVGNSLFFCWVNPEVSQLSGELPKGERNVSRLSRFICHHYDIIIVTIAFQIKCKGQCMWSLLH